MIPVTITPCLTRLVNAPGFTARTASLVREIVRQMQDGTICHHCQRPIPAPPSTPEPRLCDHCTAAGRVIEDCPF